MLKKKDRKLMSKIIYETRLTTEIILMCIIMKDSPCQSNRQLGCNLRHILLR